MKKVNTVKSHCFEEWTQWGMHRTLPHSSSCCNRAGQPWFSWHWLRKINEVNTASTWLLDKLSLYCCSFVLSSSIALLWTKGKGCFTRPITTSMNMESGRRFTSCRDDKRSYLNVWIMTQLCVCLWWLLVMTYYLLSVSAF